MVRDQLLILGETTYRNKRKRFGIKPADRRRPLYVLGKTGSGKSAFLLNCIVQDIRFGNGVVVIDPHGDLAEQVLDHIPSHRVNETIYFNPADRAFPIAFNVLHNADPTQRHLVASGVVQAFKKIWGESWGPRLEYVFRNALLALLEQPGHSLLGIPRLLTDDRYRRRVLRSVRDPMVRQFWEVEYEAYPKVFRTETISPIQNKVGQFLMNPLTRNILGQTKTKFDLLKVMDNNGILLVNLSKGLIGEDAASLLGALMISQLYLAALRRTRVVEAKRKDVFLYIDEASFVQTADLAAMLAEARKYRLNIAGMAHQYTSQLSHEVISAIFGNVGTLIAFTCGSEDAQLLAQEFNPTFSATDLQDLPPFAMYLKLSIDGKTSAPFSAETLSLPMTQSTSHRKKLIKQSRVRYCDRGNRVEENISKWLAI
jgi:hypothetical protein